MKTICILLIILFPSLLFAQEGNNLVFDNKSGLNFSTEIPCLFSTGGRAYFTSTSYSDKKGDLMFYVNQEKFYNKNHQVIEGSDTFICSGSLSGSTGGVIIPDLQDSNNLILFSVWRKRKRIENDSFAILNDKESGLYVNIINTKANHGLGKLVVQNKLMYPGFLDQLTMVRHANLKDYWIICKSDTNTFAAFLYDEQGIHPPVFSYTPKLYARIAKECKIKANTKGTQFALTNYYRENIGLIGYDTVCKFSNYFHLYNFNQNNGSIKFAKIIDEFFEVDNGNTMPDSIPWGPAFCSFSPNDSLLYINHWGLRYIGDMHCPIIQYQIYSTNSQGTKREIQYDENVQIDRMQLAPNGKILVGNYGYKFLWCIENPNAIGDACKFNPKYLAVPSFTNTTTISNVFYDYKKVSFSSIKENCKTLRFTKDCDTCFVFYTWYFGDGDSATGASTVHTYSVKGHFLVKLKATTRYGYNVWNSRQIETTDIPQINFSTANSVGCQYIAVKFNDLTVTDTTAGIITFLWDFGDGTQKRLSINAINYSTGMGSISHSYSKTGMYKVTLTFNNGFCENTLEKTNLINILPAPKPGITASIKSGCAPTIVRFSDTLSFNIVSKEYDFGDGVFVKVKSNHSLDTGIIYNTSGNYHIRQRLTGTTGCITEDTLSVKLLAGIDSKLKPEIYYATYINDSIIEVAWKPVSNATQYQLKSNSSNIILSSSKTACQIKDSHPSQAHNFQLIAVDTCENRTQNSELTKSIFTKTDIINNEFVHIQWTPYEYWQDGVSEYLLERKNGNRADWESLGAIRNVYEFSDALDQFDTITSCEICYRITAMENGHNGMQSKSNIACLYLKPTLFVPNAFSPNNDGRNEYFKPSGTGIDIYNMIIFNRWGQLVFSGSSDPQGWDGKLANGSAAPEGVYIYSIEAINKSAQPFQKIVDIKGTFLLIR